MNLTEWIDDMVITAPCAVADMPEKLYHADPWAPSLSSTMAKTLLREGGPALLRHEMTHGETHRAAYNIGHLAHELALGRGQGIEIVDAPDWRTKAARDARDAAYQEGLVPVLPDQYEAAKQASDRLLDNPAAARLLTAPTATPEISLFDVDPQTGARIRGRIDLLADDHTIVDLKTSTVDIDLWSWADRVASLGYHVQAALYLREAVHLGLCDPDTRFIHVVVSTEPPHLTAVYELPGDLLALGDIEVDRAIRLWHECTTTNQWPGLPDQIQQLPISRRLLYAQARLADAQAEQVAAALTSIQWSN